METLWCEGVVLGPEIIVGRVLESRIFISNMLAIATKIEHTVGVMQ